MSVLGIQGMNLMNPDILELSEISIRFQGLQEFRFWNKRGLFKWLEIGLRGTQDIGLKQLDQGSKRDLKLGSIIVHSGIYH